MADREDNIVACEETESQEGARPRRKYRQVCMRDAETGRRYTVNLKASDFGSVEEMEAHAKSLQKQQCEKNKMYREKLGRTKMAEILQKASEPTILPTVAPAPDGFPDVTVSDTLSLTLDKKTGSTILLLGSSKRGKSTLMMRIYEEKFKDDPDNICTLFTDNPHLKVYRGDTRLLCTYGFGDRHAKYIQMQHFLNVKTKNHYKFVDMIDDVVDKKNSPVISKMLLTYRNANITTIICLQYMMLFSRQNRANVNHTFIFGCNSAEDAESVVKNILRPYFVAMGLKKLDAMIHFYRIVTQGHSFIYIDNVHGKISFHRLAK